MFGWLSQPNTTAPYPEQGNVAHRRDYQRYFHLNAYSNSANLGWAFNVYTIIVNLGSAFSMT